MSSRADRGSVPAPIWRRLLALFVDLIPAGGLGLIAVALVIATDPTPPVIPPWNTFDIIVDYINLETARFLLSILAVTLLTTLLQTWQLRRFGVTLGTHLLGLRVQSTDPTRAITTPRLFGWVLTGIILSAFAGFTWWWGWVDPTRRAAHDRIWALGLETA